MSDTEKAIKAAAATPQLCLYGLLPPAFVGLKLLMHEPFSSFGMGAKELGFLQVLIFFLLVQKYNY
jgi:hypothetical protein